MLLGGILWLLSPSLAAQSLDPIIMEWPESSEPPKHQIEELSWIAGHWRGEAFGGVLDEVWLPPFGESMLGTFKLVKEGKDDFMEILTISETEAGSLELRLRHFNRDLTAWEAKDEVLQFPLIAVEEKKAYFKSFTFELIDPDHLNIHVLFSEEGEKNIMTFRYHRLKK